MSAFGSDVAEAVGKEFAFFNVNLTKAISNKIPVLRSLCSDDRRNGIALKSETASDAPVNVCTACGRKGDGTSDEVPLDQLIDSASLIGLMYSMGTVVNSHLSTSCSRLQKHGQSLAALSHDSYVDIVYAKLKDIPSYFLEEEELLEEDVEEQNAEAYNVSLCNDGEDDSLDVEDFHFLLNAMTDNNREPSRETEKDAVRNVDKRDGCHTVPELVAVFDSNKFENQLTRFPLSGGSLHAQALKYSNESPYINQKDMIPTTYKHSVCECVQAISALLQHNKEQHGMVQESKHSTGSIQNLYGPSTDTLRLPPSGCGGNPARLDCEGAET